MKYPRQPRPEETTAMPNQHGFIRSGKFQIGFNQETLLSEALSQASPAIRRAENPHNYIRTSDYANVSHDICTSGQCSAWVILIEQN